MTGATGVNVLWPNAGPDDPTAAWLREHRAAAELPPPYLVDNALTAHLQAALWFVELELTARQHVHAATGAPFRCVSYVADDLYAAAYSTRHDDTFVTVVGNAWLYRLVKICDHLREAMAQRPGHGGDDVTVARDEELSELLWGNHEVSEAEAVEIAAGWPTAPAPGDELELGVWVVFYDLVRIVWVHEWAHALCGHVDLGRDELQFMRLYESSTERPKAGGFGDLGYPTAEVMQCLEMHADEFAVTYNLREILYGFDPASGMSDQPVDLVDRLVHLNTAFCVFALVWALDEIKELTDSAPWEARSHPPVGLRYDRFRGFERQEALGYDARLMSAVDAASFSLLGDALSAASGVFGSLLVWTPMVVRTPSMDRLEAYEGHLLRIEPELSAALGRHANFPTQDPRADDDAR